MNTHKRSRVWNIPKVDLQNLIDNSNSYSEILHTLKYDAKTGGGYKTLLLRIKSDNLDTKKLEENRTSISKSRNPFTNQKSLPLAEILTENSKYSRQALKRRLIKENVLEYKCCSCGITNRWNNKEISLHLDHINGVNDDNRIDNLRFLCPNCHSQTETYAGKKNKKVKLNTPRNRKRKFEVSKEELINLIKQYPMTKVGEILGVSDNAVRKRCRLLEIDYKNL